MNPVIVTGMGYSGVTHLWWILAHDPLVRNKFPEPLHPELPKQFQQEEHFRDYARKKQIYTYWDPSFALSEPWLVPGMRYPGLKHYLQYIFRGRTLVESHRLNLRTEWILSNFRSVRVIYMLRDPRAIAFLCTRGTARWNFKPEFRQCMERPAYQEVFTRFYDSDLLHQVFILWKAYTEYQLQTVHDRHLIVRYEDLCLKTSETLNSIYSFLKRTTPLPVKFSALIGPTKADKRWKERTHILDLTAWREIDQSTWNSIIDKTETRGVMTKMGYLCDQDRFL